MTLHLSLNRVPDRLGPDRRSHRWWVYWPDKNSYGAFHLGRYRIDFGWRSDA